MLTIQSLNPDKRLSVTIAIFFAEDVLPIWERQYPEDMRPRAAIEAAKAWLTNPCEETAADAYAYAADAADAAAYAANAAATANAANAAYATAHAATAHAAHADAAAYAAHTASSSANADTANRKLYTHNKLVQLLPHLFEYKIFTKTSFKDPEKIFDLLSEKNQQRFLFNLDHLR